jgi:S1-C subfamily serine protease
MSAARVLRGVVAAAVAVAVAWAPVAPDRAAPPRVHGVSVGGSGTTEFATGFGAGGDRVVTVAHVLDAGPAVSVDGRRATVVRVDRRDDLAVLAVAGLKARAIRTGAGASGPVALLGRPARVRRAVTAIVRRDPRAEAVRRPALDLDAAVAAGDSGAPVIGRDGRVVGVLFAASRERARTAYAVDGTALGALLRETSKR